MRVQTEVIAWNKPLTALTTVMPRGREPCHPAADTALCDLEVKRQTDESTIWTACQLCSPADRTFLACDLDGTISPQVPSPLPAAFTGLMLLEGLVRPNEHPITLIVEIGPLIDECKIRDGKRCSAPLWAARGLGNLLHTRYTLASLDHCLGRRQCGLAGADTVEELCHYAQGDAVLSIVRRKRLLESSRAGRLPLLSPHDALDA